jgi:general stress protein YciG
MNRRTAIASRRGAALRPWIRSGDASFAQNRDLAANAGRKGGAASRGGGRRPSANS